MHLISFAKTGQISSICVPFQVKTLTAPMVMTVAGPGAYQTQTSEVFKTSEVFDRFTEEACRHW